MLPQNPFLQLAYPRLKSCARRLNERIWEHVADVEVSYGGSSEAHGGIAEGRKRKFQSVRLPFPWGRLFDQGWFRLAVPRGLKRRGGNLFLRWEDQGEGTLYADGVPYYGFDVAHRHCPLPQARELMIESLCLQSAIWHPDATGMDSRGSRLAEASIQRRDPLAWDVFHDFSVLLDILERELEAHFGSGVLGTVGNGHLQPIDAVSPFLRRLLRFLDDAVCAFDAGGLVAMKKVLTQTYREFEGRGLALDAILTGHAHIDLVWLWPERVGEYKAVHTFSTAERLMELYPEFRFGYSQPASYEAVGRRSPALMRKVSKRIQSGSWEAVGATEVESDTLLACGEALVRSFLVGQRRFEEISGKPSRVLWIPDVFGYAGCLPQIMRQTGVDFFFTTKLTWSNVNLFPYSSFVWRGIDGSEVVVHVTQGNGYNQTVSAAELRTGALEHRQSDIHREFLAPSGYGDGGGGVTEEMCERARRLADLDSMPRTKWGRVDEFFDRLDQQRSLLPVFQGELVLEYHRGVYTTHGDLKAAFREAERALQIWEAVRVATRGGALKEEFWRRVIFAQFHDYIPGSSIAEVYEEGIPELREISAQALSSAASDLAKGRGKRAPAIFNPLPYERGVLVDGEAVRLAPLSGAPLPELPRCGEAGSVASAGRALQSERVKAEFDGEARIARLEIDGTSIPVASPLAAFTTYPDHPHHFAAWEIDRQTLSLANSVRSKAEQTDSSTGEFEAELVFKKQLTDRSSAIIRYRVDALHPVLHIDLEIDWHDEATLLKLLFPTRYAGRNARFGAPFGSIQRGQQPGLPRDEAQFEVVGSRYAAVADDTELDGLAVITEAKYGFSCRDGMLGVSLLRSARITGSDASHRRLFPASLRRPTKMGDFSDVGKHRIRLALGRHSATQPREERAAALADLLYTPPVAYRGGAISSGFLGLEGGDSLLPVWAKPEGPDRWTLRLNEVSGLRGESKILLDPGWKARLVDLLGRPVGRRKSRRSLRFSPYELISLELFRS